MAVNRGSWVVATGTEAGKTEARVAGGEFERTTAGFGTDGGTQRAQANQQERHVV